MALDAPVRVPLDVQLASPPRRRRTPERRILGEFYGMNLACLDDATPAELAVAPLEYRDGQNNKWESALAETRQL